MGEALSGLQSENGPLVGWMILGIMPMKIIALVNVYKDPWINET